MGAISPPGFLPSQMVSFPSHFSLDWQVLSQEPRKTNPESHHNRTLLGYTVRFPEEDPFKGDERTPQSTAKMVETNKCKIKRIQKNKGDSKKLKESTEKMGGL